MNDWKKTDTGMFGCPEYRRGDAVVYLTRYGWGADVRACSECGFGSAEAAMEWCELAEEKIGRMGEFCDETDN